MTVYLLVHVHHAGVNDYIIAMENFLELLEKGVVHSIQKLPAGCCSEPDVIKFLQRIIFKHDILIEFKEILSSACSSKPFIVKNVVVKNVVVQLNDLLSSNLDRQIKINAFRCLFISFAATSKGEDGVPVIQFFIVLCHILGLEPSKVKSKGFTDVINSENFNEAFGVSISKPSSVSFSIFKELLTILSKLSINFNLSEIQPYHKWLQYLIRNLTDCQKFKVTFLEIFTISAGIDLKLVEGNLEQIFSWNLTASTDEDFFKAYDDFLTEVFKIFAKFQRSVKFVSKFVSSVKSTPTLLTTDVILPSNFMNEFSKTVKMATSQQSIALMELLVQNVGDSCIAVEENKSGFELLRLVASKLLSEFLKEVKLFAPSVSSTTLETFIDKLNGLKDILKKFCGFLFSNNDFIKKTDDSVATFLELCFYCQEIETLINCYKDSVSHLNEIPESSDDWQSCLNVHQWNCAIKIVMKSKLEKSGSICFQLALQRLRILKLQQKSSQVDDSTVKIILSLMTSNFSKVTPEDMTILMESLTINKSKAAVKKVVNEILNNAEDSALMAWLSDPILQENPTFVIHLLSELLKETGSALADAAGDKNSAKFEWLLEEYFDEENNIPEESLHQLPEKLNALLGSSRKVRKWLSDLEGNFAQRVMKVFGRLPLVHMRGDIRRLGLSFAVALAVVSAEESAASLALETIHGFLMCGTDASTCFDVGLCIRWLSELSFEGKHANGLRAKVIEGLVRHSPNMKFGLQQLGGAIDGEGEPRARGGATSTVVETQVVLYQELGKCWQRAKKRAADNDLIGCYRNKLAKVISEHMKELDEGKISRQNSHLIFKILAIELNKAVKMEDEEEISKLMKLKFPSYFNFAVEEMKTGFDEASSWFLFFILSLLPQIRKHISDHLFREIWEALKTCDKGNWRLFASHSEKEEFKMVVDDLLRLSREFLNPESNDSPNYLEIWTSFIEESSHPKKQICQLRLQHLFDYVHDSHLLLGHLPTRKKISLIRFFSFCISKRKVIMTPQMLDAVARVLIECLNDSPPNVEDFHDLFVAETETASFILLREFDWTKNRVHLTFVLFKRMLDSLAKKCDAGRQLTTDEVLMLSACALSLEKWTSHMCRREKDFSRTAAYFVTSVVSAIASVSVLPAIKIHLVNCINHFLSISDLHTVSYLLRILKPGYQQVFNTIYTQFKKFHKYTGKI